MVFTIGDLWDTLGAAGGKVKKTVAERPKWIFEGWGVQPRAKGMPLEKVITQEARVVGGYPRAALGGLWAGVTGKEPTTPTTTPTKGNCGDTWYYVTHLPECAGESIERHKPERPAIVDWTPPTAEEMAAAFSGVLPEGFGVMPDVDFDLSQLGLTEGMAAMGQALAAALAGMKPEITVPTGLTDEEGKIPPTVLIGAAVVGLGAIYLIGRKK